MCNLFLQIVFAVHGVNKIGVLIMHVWFFLSQEYALPLIYIIRPPGGFFGMQLVGYNIVMTSAITVLHILCVKDLSIRLSFLNAMLCLSTTSTEMYTQ